MKRDAWTRMGRVSVSAAVLVMLSLLPACSGYQLRGKAIEGEVSSVTVVDRHDPRLAGPGLRGVRIQTTLDPRALGQKRLPAAQSDEVGEFGVPVRETGAGLLTYSVQVLARRGGYQTAIDSFPLPGGDKRVLITLAPGRDTYQGQADDVLDETLRIGEPYMRD